MGILNTRMIKSSDIDRFITGISNNSILIDYISYRIYLKNGIIIPVVYIDYVEVKAGNNVEKVEMTIENLSVILAFIDKLKNINNNGECDGVINSIYNRIKEYADIETFKDSPSAKIINILREVFPDIALRCELGD